MFKASQESAGIYDINFIDKPPYTNQYCVTVNAMLIIQIKIQEVLAIELLNLLKIVLR